MDGIGGAAAGAAGGTRRPSRGGAETGADRRWPPASLLGSLDPGAREVLLRLGAAVQYPEASRVLIREGEESRFVVILLDGVVKATGLAPDGREILLAVRMGGDLVGEFAALDDRPRSATVTTCGAVLARVVRHADFLDCLRRHPGVAHAVNRAVVGKLRSANARRVDFGACDVPTRVARVLYEIAVAYGEREGNRSVIRWPLTQPELATLAGAAEPSVHKALRHLREEAVVATGYRSVTVLDLARLGALGSP
ncbi:Crp/Fnr family transcriptional regulator [Streptomyces sp. B1866]|uniref:Crp/Fnr family transcriptional regulator n=1 Tax=Streptomyces sp. B1866 TaxID=3075431 RepID=UPI00288DD7AE|nr:Crp/Fnr family transcriptional regulator [Streptomyces sp. B1866]MDT3398069.1 Crp/Fnr family transcriptional regulator [Streptomyces sp. B1866]